MSNKYWVKSNLKLQSMVNHYSCNRSDQETLYFGLVNSIDNLLLLILLIWSILSNNLGACGPLEESTFT